MGLAISDTSKRWPGSAVAYLMGPMSPATTNPIKLAITSVEAASSFGFAQRTPSDSDYIQFEEHNLVDSLSSPPIVDSSWKSIQMGHKLINLGGGRILDWESYNGHYRVWEYNPNVTGNNDIFAGVPVVDHSWNSIQLGHELIVLGSDRVLDWEPSSGHYRVWSYDATVTGNNDIFAGTPVAEGEWSSITVGHLLLGLGNDRFVDWEPIGGHYRVWQYRP